jgi:hypothetical protein
MDLRALSDRVGRWVSTGGDPGLWQEFVEFVDGELRLTVGACEDDWSKAEPYESDAAWVAEGRALFDELSRLTDSPARVKRLRDAMDAFGRSLVPTFSLRGGPALVVVRGGAPERPSGRYIDSANPEPEAS